MNFDTDVLKVPITECELRLCMRKINNRKSVGLNNIYPEFIKFVSDELILMITIFQNNT